MLTDSIVFKVNSTIIENLEECGFYFIKFMTYVIVMLAACTLSYKGIFDYASM